MKITPEIYKDIVEHTLATAPYNFRSSYKCYIYDGPIRPKERPRFTSKGRAFTAPETRKFEAALIKWAKDCIDTAVGYPIRAVLVLRDETISDMLAQHSRLGLIYHDHGDVDNYAKAVFDALNKVAYRDDKQIVDVRIRREYARKAGFSLVIERAGLSKAEYTEFLKYLKVERAK